MQWMLKEFGWEITLISFQIEAHLDKQLDDEFFCFSTSEELLKKAQMIVI